MTKGGKHHVQRRRRVKRMFANRVHLVCSLMVPVPLDPTIEESPHPHEDGGFL